MAKKKHWPPLTEEDLNEEDKKLWRMVKTFSPEDFARWQKEVAAIFVNLLSREKTPEELIETRDKMLASFQSVPTMTAELKKKFHEALSTKKDRHFRRSKAGDGRRE